MVCGDGSKNMVFHNIMSNSDNSIFSRLLIIVLALLFPNSAVVLVDTTELYKV